MYPSWVEVSKSAIVHNLASYQKVVGKHVAVMPIVKSNAYGHGMVEVAKLVAPRVKWLGVVNLAEALALRRQGIKKRIFVLSYVDEHNLTLAEGIKNQVDLPLYSLRAAKEISAKAKKLKKIAKVHVKFDTGTTRVGVPSGEAVGFIKKVRILPNIKIEGVYSHFAASEENQRFTSKQLARFEQVLRVIEDLGIKVPERHISCSAAALTKPNARFTMVRLGVALYGLWPSAKMHETTKRCYPWLSLQPALAWKTRFIQAKTVEKGTAVSYGCTYIAKKKMTVGVLAIGYWEGYDRHLSNRGVVVIGGQRCSVIGRVCMNLTMVDISRVRGVKVGDEAVLLGPKNSADEMAEKIGTINYEVVTRISPLLKRIYVK